MGVPLLMEPNFNDYSCQGFYFKWKRKKSKWWLMLCRENGINNILLFIFCAFEVMNCSDHLYWAFNSSIFMNVACSRKWGPATYCCYGSVQIIEANQNILACI
ncbi:uncharacterized protein LOC120005559 [Tripterygium wilfordii]|uniref:uncharacterized protein LOC120005559 n=1 Tax=Tripterygium wilfordii TaxID=458696 RepID=UPI0018F7F880|nr:uncharacterized protein LOC120005559 [Tripterygium wilfordii]